jgi:hypothetical protein
LWCYLAQSSESFSESGYHKVLQPFFEGAESGVLVHQEDSKEEAGILQDALRLDREGVETVIFSDKVNVQADKPKGPE